MVWRTHPNGKHGAECASAATTKTLRTTRCTAVAEYASVIDGATTSRHSSLTWGRDHPRNIRLIERTAVKGTTQKTVGGLHNESRLTIGLARFESHITAKRVRCVSGQAA